MKNKKLGHFSKDQTEYICLCLALDLPIPKIVDNFQTICPEFGDWLPPKDLKYKLARRISDIKRKKTDQIEVCRQKAERSESYRMLIHPMSHVEVRIRKLEEMYFNLPSREKVGEFVTSDGERIPRYKYNIKEKVKILLEIQREIRSHPFIYEVTDEDGNKTEYTREQFYALLRGEEPTESEESVQVKVRDSYSDSECSDSERR